MRHWTWLFPVYCILCFHSAFAQGLVDPGFENGSLNPWTVAQGSAYAGTTAHTGSQGLTVPGSNVTTIVSQTLTGLTPGQTYRVSAWVRADAWTPSPELAMRDPSLQDWATAGPAWVSTGWQRMSRTYTVDSSGQIQVNLYTWSSTVTVYWDDVTVTQAVFANGDFEMLTLDPWTVTDGTAYVGTTPHTGGQNCQPAGTCVQNGTSPELSNAALIYGGVTTDAMNVANAKCFFSPDHNGWVAMQGDISHPEITVVPTVNGDPACFVFRSQGGVHRENEQFVYKASIPENANGNGAPAFIFVQYKRSSDPAVIQIP